MRGCQGTSNPDPTCPVLLSAAGAMSCHPDGLTVQTWGQPRAQSGPGQGPNHFGKQPAHLTMFHPKCVCVCVCVCVCLCFIASFTPIYLAIIFGASGKEPSCQCRRRKDMGLIPGSRRCPGEENGNPLQYSCLGNSMEPGRLQSLGSQRVDHDRSNFTHLELLQSSIPF